MLTECIFWKTIALSMEENGYICTLFQIENRAVVFFLVIECGSL